MLGGNPDRSSIVRTSFAKLFKLYIPSQLPRPETSNIYKTGNELGHQTDHDRILYEAVHEAKISYPKIFALCIGD